VWTDVLLVLCVYVCEERGDGEVIHEEAETSVSPKISAVSLLSDTDNSVVSVVRRVRTSTTWNQS
jgi:hypothetical protein